MKLLLLNNCCSVFGHRNASSLRYKPCSSYMQNMMFMRPLKVTASSDSAIWISLFSTDFEQYKKIGAVTIIIDTPTTRAFHQNFLFNLIRILFAVLKRYIQIKTIVFNGFSPIRLFTKSVMWEFPFLTTSETYFQIY